MTKNILYILVLILIITQVTAISFDEDTKFSEGNINYIFKEGIEIENFDITNKGIEIGDNKIELSIQGGVLDVVFYEFNNTNKNISLKSSVPQKVDFNIQFSGVNQYLYDSNTYYKNSLNLPINEVFFIFSALNNDNGEKITKISDSTEKLVWYKQKLTEFEIKKELNNKGIIENKTFSITYLSLTFIFTFISFLGVAVWRLRR